MPKRSRSSSVRRSIFKRKRLLTSLLIIILLLAGLGVWYWRYHRSSNKPTATGTTSQTPNNKIDYSPATPADNTANNNRKGSTNPSSTIDTYQSPPNTGSFSVSISRAGLDSSKQNLQVATLINGVSSGTCTLSVHQAGQQTVTKSEDITLQVNSYVCPVISIPLSQFPNQGSWNVSMTVASNGKTVSSDWANNPVSL